MHAFMAEALAEAQAGFEEGGSPIGAVLVKDGEIIGRGRNVLIQKSDPTGHAEMEAYRDAARRAAATHAPHEIDDQLNGGTMYTTMMPCEMCAGAIIRFAARRVVVGETKTYIDSGTHLLMERQGIEVAVLQSPDCVALIEMYLRRYPERRTAMTLRKAPVLRL